MALGVAAGLPNESNSKTDYDFRFDAGSHFREEKKGKTGRPLLAAHSAGGCATIFLGPAGLSFVYYYVRFNSLDSSTEIRTQGVKGRTIWDMNIWDI